MIVVAIIAIFMTVSIPFINTAIDGGKGMNRAVKDVQEACSHARAIAILQQTTSELIIHPRDGTLEVGASSAESTPHGGLDSPSVNGGNWRMAERKPAKSSGSSGFSVKLPDSVHIKGLGVNGEDWTDDDVARVRFKSNGTCDEMSIVLIDERNQTRNIWLEVVTALSEVESDESKFKAR
jgi:hypothetical protein